MATVVGFSTIIPFVALFVLFIILGFYGKYWRRSNLNEIYEWSLAGRRLGTTLVFFLLGADIYTSFAFVALPSGVFAKGSIYFLVYAPLTFAIALVIMPRLLSLSKEKRYITSSDFIKDRFGSTTLSILVATTGIVSLLPYIALQIVGMQSVLVVMLLGTANFQIIEEIALVVSFVILAAFTYTSGLRGATLTAVFKDVIVWVTVIALIVVVPLSISGGFNTAFSHVKPNYVTVPGPLIPGYVTLMLGGCACIVPLSSCDKWCFELRKCK